MWKVMTKRKRIVGFASFFIILSVLFYIAAVANDWYFVPFNPPPPPTSIIMPMLIPPAITNETVPWPDLYLGISLQANGTIAEGVELTLAGAGEIASYNYNLRFISIQVFFQESLPWQLKNSSTLLHVQQWPSGIVLQRNMTDTSDMILWSKINNTEIYFPAAGDYSPTVLIGFKQEKPIEYTYDAIKIHVASNSDIQNAKFTRINTALTNALVLFALIESISIMRDFTADKTRRPS